MMANILDGIVLGLQFGLLAAGLTLIYGLGGVLNLGYGQIAVTSAMIVTFAMDAGVSVVPAVGLGLLAGGLERDGHGGKQNQPPVRQPDYFAAAAEKSPAEQYQQERHANDRDMVQGQMKFGPVHG